MFPQYLDSKDRLSEHNLFSKYFKLKIHIFSQYHPKNGHQRKVSAASYTATQNIPNQQHSKAANYDRPHPISFTTALRMGLPSTAAGTAQSTAPVYFLCTADFLPLWERVPEGCRQLNQIVTLVLDGHVFQMRDSNLSGELGQQLLRTEIEIKPPIMNALLR